MTESPAIRDVTTADFATVVIEGSRERPVLVDFWADWCGPCKMLAPVLERLAAEYDGAFLLAKVDTDREQQLAAEYGIRGIPNVKLFRNGQLVDEFTGVQPEPAIRALLDRHLPRASDQALHEAQAARAAGDPAKALRILQEATQADSRNERLYPELVELLLATGDAAAAAEALAGADPEIRRHPVMQALEDRLYFAPIAADGPGREALERRLREGGADAEARHRLAAHCVLAGDYGAALEHLLRLLQDDPAFADGAAHRELLKLFELLGPEDERVKQARRRMALALH